ncbi:MAG: bifunctional DNA-formamidopyrimidine glycosylase/DNA-(apurinic or apyrimidinic site) lyase [Desulfobulbaceae bacterium]|nr:bifunctional DNA-formamidopyrimidine glycosylase/DNA-(apurinic or apyrimidinic site) lyase [Desulfobulbaceae bacterium]
MPELPEVEVICRGLEPNLVNRSIIKASFGQQSMRLPLPIEETALWVTGHKVVAVRRRAKFIMVGLDSAATLLIHLGMTGRLNFFPVGSAVAKHDHARWLLDNGLELRFNDTRRFGSLRIIAPGQDQAEVLGELGPDPFWPEFNADYLAALAKGRRVPVKSFLMDNRVATGIGNIYASEILFTSGINPTTPVAHLAAQEWQKVVANSQLILTEAIACGGTTISDYVNSRGEKGYFQTKLRVYGRTGEACPNCGGAISQVRLGGRASFYCPACQPSQSKDKPAKKRR